MRIAIDARLIHETGVGRYIRNLIAQLAIHNTEYTFIVFLLAKDIDSFTLPNSHWEKRVADVHWHTVKEQFIMPWLFWKENVDLVHVPYFNVPIFYPRKFIVTIHDLTILHVHTGKASTLPYWKYILRKMAYRLILVSALFRAKQILTVSQSVKDDILANFFVPTQKIHVTYEGIDDTFLLTNHDVVKRSSVSEPYFLYVGNVYPHKNVEVLLEALRILQRKHSEKIKLVFVGPDDYFYSRLSTLITSLSMNGVVEIRHSISDSDLGNLYANALALVFPSRMEGFGLPALEAISQGCLVIASDIPVFHEVLQSFALYADTTNSDALSRVMNEALHDRGHVHKQNSERLSFLSRYSWEKMAKQTYNTYSSCI